MHYVMYSNLKWGTSKQISLWLTLAVSAMISNQLASHLEDRSHDMRPAKMYRVVIA